MKLLVDAMWPPSVAEQLRRNGHDVVAAIERPDLARTGDPRVLRYAVGEHRVVVTEDSGDFRRLAERVYAQGQSHFGFVFTSNRSFPRGDSRTFGRLVRALDTLLIANPDLTNSEYWLRPPD